MDINKATVAHVFQTMDIDGGIQAEILKLVNKYDSSKDDLSEQTPKARDEPDTTTEPGTNGSWKWKIGMPVLISILIVMALLTIFWPRKSVSTGKVLGEVFDTGTSVVKIDNVETSVFVVRIVVKNETNSIIQVSDVSSKDPKGTVRRAHFEHDPPERTFQPDEEKTFVIFVPTETFEFEFPKFSLDIEWRSSSEPNGWININTKCQSKGITPNDAICRNFLRLEERTRYRIRCPDLQ